MMEKEFNKKALTRAATLIKAKQPDNRSKLRGCAYYNILIPLSATDKGEVNAIGNGCSYNFISGFAAAKVCDYIKELDKENEI